MTEAIVFGIGGYIIRNFISLNIGFITSKICSSEAEEKIGNIFMIFFWILYIIFLFNSDIVRWKGILSFIILIIFHLVFQMITIHAMMSNNRKLLLFMMGIISLISVYLIVKIL